MGLFQNVVLDEYISAVNKQYATANATEHSYRPALQNFLVALLPGLTVVNEPKRSACGAPDYILLRGDVPVAFIEAKDFAKTSDLTGKKENKEQFDRYKKSLDNIIFTDYLDFLLYENGEFVDSVKLAEIKGDKIIGIQENEAKFISLIERFGNARPQRITSSARLAEIMAGKARLLADVIEKSLNADTEGESDLYGQMKAFEQVLIHDITPKTFADIYAQTIAYGMFAARLHDKSPDTFSRMEAATLIPKTNPFLRQIFQNIAGYDLDERIAWIVDDLAEAFRATDIKAVMSGYGKRTRQTDPILHFYEDFLSAYDPALRKSRGVWYTPQPVVSYVVRAVDEILQKDFGLPMGLADTSKTKMTVANQKSKKKDNDTYDVEVHKVQILDPATGTGTFLAEAISCIYEKFEGQQGLWQGYVEEHLLPRLNGFELLMASYAMAHLKLDMILSETGYVAKQDKRLRVYLTNSLEEYHPDTGTLFVQALANEANQANHIKRDTPVMVVMGNPPYSGESANKGDWIMKLMESYKKEPNTNSPLKERNPKWINDDYCKFIRLGQDFVERNTEGVLAYINNHSFLDNPTFRGMRWNLLQSFDKIYIIDLHGNSKKKETSPDGGKDENVFDIQQGVSINIFVKTGGRPKGQLAEVYHLDLFGKRQSKYDYLSEHDFLKTPFIKLQPTEPFYFFIPRNTADEGLYNKGFSVNELFSVNSVGVVTANDSTLINFDKQNLLKEVSTYYNIDADEKFAQPISYRPFDNRHIYYDTSKVERARVKFMQHFLAGDNVGLVVPRQAITDNWSHIQVTKYITDNRIHYSNKGIPICCPLYLYNTDGQTTTDGNNRIPNLKPEIVKAIADKIGLQFEAEKTTPSAGTHFAPIDLLDYIYGVLHTPSYRERYKEFLKVDFPRIPYPETAAHFRTIAEVGGRLRRLHLMEELPKGETRFNVSGTNTVDTVTATAPNEEGRIQVWVNDTQYFDNVPAEAWTFYIGGYQPAQKWLKDRKGRPLTYDDITHYQRIITALTETNKLMQTLSTETAIIEK